MAAMTNPSERISQLKIDRSAPPSPKRSWLWVVIAAVVAAGALLWCFIKIVGYPLTILMAIGAVGGFFPAIRAARLPVAQALREL